MISEMKFSEKKIENDKKKKKPQFINGYCPPAGTHLPYSSRENRGDGDRD